MEPTEGQFALAVDTFKLMADNTRLRIVWALLHGEHSVNELASHLLVNSAGVSQHLAKLRSARLVNVRRDGNKAFYSLRSGHVQQLVEHALFHADDVADNDLEQRDGTSHQARGQR